MELPKIFIFSLPATGHINTILSVASELVKRKRYEVIFYSSNDFRLQIEATGAIFRSYENKFTFCNQTATQFNNKKKNTLFGFMKNLADVTDKIIVKLANDINNDKPKVVIYDQFALYAKWAVRMIDQYYGRKINTHLLKPTSAAPPAIMYITSFPVCENVYPNAIEQKIVQISGIWSNLKFILNAISLLIKQFFFCRKYKLKFIEPLTDQFKHAEKLNLVFISPFIQPRAHLFGNQFKFVGCCINEKIHHDGHINKYSKTVEDILSIYEPRNPTASIEILKDDKRKLIYVAFGSLYNNNNDLILKIINAFVRFNEEPEGRYKLDQLDILISVSKNTLLQIEGLVDSKKINLPENIYLVDGVPQLEILKRASLFITHCGMNSVSEAVHYGVPLLCIPLTGDQPLVSYRVAIELGLGIELSFINLKSEKVREAVHNLLTDVGYHKRILFQSKLSRQYVGDKMATDAILNFIN